MARYLALALVACLAGLAAGCGGSVPAAEPPAQPPADTGGQATAPDEDAWVALLSGLGLEPDQFKVDIAGSRDGSDLAITITVPQDAPKQYTFADGLYGAQAFAFVDGQWKRVDTADIRTEIAPLLDPGQSAELRLPVPEADVYRVLVPVEGFAAWADIS